MSHHSRTIYFPTGRKIPRHPRNLQGLFSGIFVYFLYINIFSYRNLGSLFGMPRETPTESVVMHILKIFFINKREEKIQESLGRQVWAGEMVAVWIIGTSLYTHSEHQVQVRMCKVIQIVSSFRSQGKHTQEREAAIRRAFDPQVYAKIKMYEQELNPVGSIE